MKRIRRSLVPVLLLATVALSSSNVLPMVSINKLEPEQLGLESQQDDNIFSFRNHPRNILNDIFYTVSIATSQNGKQNKLQKLPRLQYVDIDNNQIDDDPNVSNKDKYNGEGFRKEQWHNYPRQLDRLHKYLYEHHNHNSDKKNPDPGDPTVAEDYVDGTVQDSPIDTKANEIETNTHDDLRNGYDTVVAVANPFLIFKIRLPCLNGAVKDNNGIYSGAASEPEYIPGHKDEENYLDNIIYPKNTASKVKREEVPPQNTQTAESAMTKNQAVKKRIFSLWSRLQSFNHKGHELQHRRHLHAFYGLPDGDTGGVLTAETRATFMRPPGSPLRWG